ncbi:MAG: hypothetical protein ABIP21_12885 [Acidimicrobiia bacterium]
MVPTPDVRETRRPAAAVGVDERVSGNEMITGVDESSDHVQDVATLGEFTVDDHELGMAEVLRQADGVGPRTPMRVAHDPLDRPRSGDHVFVDSFH